MRFSLSLTSFSARNFCRLVILPLLAVSLITGCRPQSTEDRANAGLKLLSWKIGLDDQQKLKLDEVKKAYLQAHAARKSERQKTLAEVREMITSEKVDSAKARAILSQRQQATQQDFDSVFSKVIEFHSSLREDQKRKLLELLDDYSARWVE
jgi:Spy/CpxP family protein refolding chaperone